MNIYEKLHDIQTKVKGLGKDSKSYNFQYVSGNKLLSFIRPIMDDHKLLLKQEVLSIDNERMDYATNKGTKSEILSKVMMRFTWVDVDSGETDVNLFGANGQNDWEKGLGSALTYAERYFLMKYFHIATDEDDIDNPDRKPQTQPAPKKSPANQTSEPVTPVPATSQQIENIALLATQLEAKEIKNDMPAGALYVSAKRTDQVGQLHQHEAAKLIGALTTKLK